MKKSDGRSRPGEVGQARIARFDARLLDGIGWHEARPIGPGVPAELNAERAIKQGAALAVSLERQPKWSRPAG